MGNNKTGKSSIDQTDRKKAMGLVCKRLNKDHGIKAVAKPGLNNGEKIVICCTRKGDNKKPGIDKTISLNYDGSLSTEAIVKTAVRQLGLGSC